MIKTRQQSALGRIWHNLNQSWGVAVGFLMLLFIIPLAVIISDPNHQNLTNSNADATHPLVVISPSQGQGTKSQFIAEVRDTNVDRLEYADVWFGTNAYNANQVTGNYATVKFRNFGVGGDMDWRAQVYNIQSNAPVNQTSLKPDDNPASNLSKIYSTPSSKVGEVTLSTTDSIAANASIKYRKVSRVSDNTLRFYIDVEFKSNFSDKNINIYMKAQRGAAFGGTTSSITVSEWTMVGSWIVAADQAKSSVPQNEPPKFNSVPTGPITTATVGKLYKYEILATDPEGDPLKYQITSSPVPAFLSLKNNILSGTPTASDIGSKTVSIMIVDTVGNSATQTFTLVVSNPSPTATPTVAPTINTDNIQSPRLSRRTPEEGVITDTKPTISAVVNAGSADPDLSTLVVTLDGNDITSKLEKGVNSFSYKPTSDLIIGNHEVKVIVKGKDSAGTKGILNESWTFTISSSLPGTNNQSTNTLVNKIKLPILNIVVDQWLGTLIIGIFVLLLFAILIFAIIALVRTLRGKDDDMTQITKYYQKETPASLETTKLEQVQPDVDPFANAHAEIETPKAVMEATTEPTPVVEPEVTAPSVTTPIVKEPEAYSPFEENVNPAETSTKPVSSEDFLQTRPNPSINHDYDLTKVAENANTEKDIKSPDGSFDNLSSTESASPEQPDNLINTSSQTFDNGSTKPSNSNSSEPYNPFHE